ncbi:tetratricopeptide repeat protein [Horticoccus sp. 23ND18S-11]|uniref:tetratricopeptide repeat protein n=1 Tax=Horticoccus sp. 23ND18S-11 TaxID=3391832 RepID=UPI0039C9E9BD
MAPPSGSAHASARAFAASRALAGGLIVGAGLAAYCNSFPGILVFDDMSSVVENATIRQLWPIGPALSPPIEAGVGGRPFANLTLAFNHAISGTQPWSYHALNVAIHLAAALGLYGVVHRTLDAPTWRRRWETPSRPLALAVAVLWAVHPLQTAVVNYIAQRTEALMALCALVTLYAFIRGTAPVARGWRVLAVLACGAGMASKETMAVVPLLVMLYDRAFLSGTFRAAWRAHRGLHLALASTWLVLGALMAQSHLAERGVGFGLGVSAFDYAVTQGQAVTHYLRLAFWPAPLVFDHGWAFQRDLAAATPHLLAVALLLIATAAACWRRPAWGFAGAWVVLLLAPSSSVIPIVQQPIAESRMYLPLAGIVAVATLSLWHALRQRSLFALGLLVLVGGALTAATVQRNRDYRDEIALWSDTVRKRPENARAHGNLAAAYLRAGRPREAIASSATALTLRPDYAEARHNLGTALLRSGDAAGAVEALRAAAALRPEFADTHYNLGAALAQAGRQAEAVTALENAVRLNPVHALAHNNLGVVLLTLGRIDEAIAHDRAALRLNPAFAEAHYNLGNALARTADLTGARAAYETALRAQPVFPKAHNNLGALLLRSGRRDEAVTHFEAALLQAPDYAEARRNLTIARER